MRGMTGLAFAGAAVLGASVTWAQSAAPGWIEAPSVADMAAAYPAKARAAGVGGMVNLTCTINHEGRPRDCTVLGEKPELMGFGFAARKLAEKLKIGESGWTGREVRVPVTFDPRVVNGEMTVARPAWTLLPAPSDFQATFPQAANGVNQVRVVLACTVGAGGALGGCAVDREEPAGQGYGAGALALAPKFRVAPWTAEGQPTIGAKVRLPIRYELTPVGAPKG